MDYFWTLVFLLCSCQRIISLHIFELGYRVTPEPSVKSPDYDGVILVASLPLNYTKFPTQVRQALSKAPITGDTLLDIELPAKKLIFSQTGPLSQFHDVRAFGVAAKKAIERAVKEKMESPLFILHEDINFPHAELVTLLGALEGIYNNHKNPESSGPKIKNIGVWGQEYSTLIDIVNIAANFEDGRIVSRGISDPDRMSAAKVEEYVRQVFPEGSGVNISVVSDLQTLQKDFPLFAAVNKDGNGRIILLTYQTPAPVVETLLLVGKGLPASTETRDKVGAGAVAGFLKTLSDTRVGGLKVVAAMVLSSGESHLSADQVVPTRSGKRVRVLNTGAEGRLVLADLICYMKELVEKNEASVDPYIVSVSPLTGEAQTSEVCSIVVDNGPAAKNDEGLILQQTGGKLGEPVEITVLRKEDFENFKGDELVKEGNQSPGAFLIMASGLDKHGSDAALPIKFSHIDVVGEGGGLPSGAPLLALANRFILRLEDPPVDGYH